MATFKCPEFRPASSGDTVARVAHLERALTVLIRELNFVLAHLDKANFSSEEISRFADEIYARIMEGQDHGTAP